MVLTEDILLLPLVLHGETVSDEVVEPFKVLLKTGIRENDNASIGCITREEEMVPSILLVFHIHRVDGLHAVEGLPDDGLPVTPTLPLTSAVIKDDHSSVVRGIEVVQDIPIRSGQGLQKFDSLSHQLRRSRAGTLDYPITHHEWFQNNRSEVVS